jgi:hypothetical protein
MHANQFSDIQACPLSTRGSHSPSAADIGESSDVYIHAEDGNVNISQRKVRYAES